jgi:translation elongation factor EF-Tu-like GTPase
MAKTKPTKKEAEELQKQIDEYEAKPVQNNEQPLKLDISFDEAVDKILKAAKPPKKPKEQ